MIEFKVSFFASKQKSKTNRCEYAKKGSFLLEIA